MQAAARHFNHERALIGQVFIESVRKGKKAKRDGRAADEKVIAAAAVSARSNTRSPGPRAVTPAGGGGRAPLALARARPCLARTRGEAPTPSRFAHSARAAHVETVELGSFIHARRLRPPQRHPRSDPRARVSLHRAFGPGAPSPQPLGGRSSGLGASKAGEPTCSGRKDRSIQPQRRRGGGSNRWINYNRGARCRPSLLEARAPQQLIMKPLSQPTNQSHRRTPLIEPAPWRFPRTTSRT
jgi:hypothetical protein